jgi:cytochrome c peroxidase
VKAKSVAQDFPVVCVGGSAGGLDADNLMHNLKTERFYKPRMINGRMASADGPIKTFPLRGIKDSPPYLHDDRLITLEDTVEFFNLILELKLNDQEKKDLTAFMRAL